MSVDPCYNKNVDKETKIVHNVSMKYVITDLLFSINAGLEELELYNITKADEILKDYTISEMHCIDNIERIERANVTKVSKAMNVTRGGISKLVKKLIKRGAIETYTLETNKKEIYFKLTPVGKKVFLAHEKMHHDWYKKDGEFFEQFTDGELQSTGKILAEYNELLKERLNNLEGE